MPSPPMKRQTVRSIALKASPEPIALTKKSTEPSIITRRRPQRSLRTPASTAPSAQPRSATATTNPVISAVRSNWLSIESTAPLITDESNPNRNPPTAAAIDRATARRPKGLRMEKAWVGIDAEELTRVTIAPRGSAREGLRGESLGWKPWR